MVLAQLGTMPDDIINIVCDFMPSYLKDGKGFVLRGPHFQFETHLDRLYASARALAFRNVHSREIIRAVFATLAANGIRDAHIG